MTGLSAFCDPSCNPSYASDSGCIQLTENQVLAFKGRRFEIICLSGLIWLTDGVGGDRTIQSGQRVALNSKGKICVQAFAPSTVRIAPQAASVPIGLQPDPAVAK